MPGGGGGGGGGFTSYFFALFCMCTFCSLLHVYFLLSFACVLFALFCMCTFCSLLHVYFLLSFACMCRPVLPKDHLFSTSPDSSSPSLSSKSANDWELKYAT